MDEASPSCLSVFSRTVREIGPSGGTLPLLPVERGSGASVVHAAENKREKVKDKCLNEENQTTKSSIITQRTECNYCFCFLALVLKATQSKLISGLAFGIDRVMLRMQNQDQNWKNSENELVNVAPHL